MARTAGSHSDITGPRVRAAALKLFARHGYAAVSMRQLAAEVGVQAGALYMYSPDKQSMLFDLMRTHMTDLLAAWAVEPVHAGPDPAGPVTALEAFVRFHIRFELDHPEAVQLCALEHRSLEPANQAAFDTLRHSHEAALEAILRQGQAEKLFTFADPKIVARALLSMLSGVAHWYRSDGKLGRERIERIYWNLTRKSVGA